MENSTEKKKAFPVICPRTGGVIIDSGMTLRDYFAGQAMQGLCADLQSYEANLNELAIVSYAIADAMLKVRQSPPDKESGD